MIKIIETEDEADTALTVKPILYVPASRRWRIMAWTQFLMVLTIFIFVVVIVILVIYTVITVQDAIFEVDQGEFFKSNVSRFISKSSTTTVLGNI